MDNYNLQYDDEQDPSSLPAESYLGFPGQVGNYAYGAMLPQDAALPPQNFERSQPPDLEGRLSNVMLTYNPTGVSMPMNIDPTNAFAYDAQAYPPTTMGMPQFQSAYAPFQPSVPGYAQPTPARKEPYDTSTDSTVNFEDSDFSARNSDRSQVPPRAPRRVEKLQPAPRPSQPVAIQPKKPALALGMLHAPAVSAISTDEPTDDLSPGLEKPEIGKTEHTGIYSSSGFDVLGALVSAWHSCTH
jgi:pre-rRNA-processing protein SRD1